MKPTPSGNRETTRSTTPTSTSNDPNSNNEFKTYTNNKTKYSRKIEDYSTYHYKTDYDTTHNNYSTSSNYKDAPSLTAYNSTYYKLHLRSNE